MKIWSDTEYVYRCLADKQRTLAFKAAIEAVVKPDSVVLDVGTGSGVMAMFAAKAGARRVYAVEVGKYLSKVSRQIFAASGYADRIVPLRIEARELDAAMLAKPDVVICEQVTTGLIGEPQGPVINALKKSGVIDSHTVLIPAGFATSIALVRADYNFYGIYLKFPIFVDYFTRSFDNRHQMLSEEKLAHTVKFSEDFDETVSIKERITASQDGTANGLLLSSLTSFFGEADLGTCVSYAQPVILPLEDLALSVGSIVEVSVKYGMGEGFDSLEYDVKLLDA
jgi:predicted RNA methylase